MHDKATGHRNKHRTLSERLWQGYMSMHFYIDNFKGMFRLSIKMLSRYGQMVSRSILVIQTYPRRAEEEVSWKTRGPYSLQELLVYKQGSQKYPIQIHVKREKNVREIM